MRLNQYLAKHTTLSRRSADTAIADGRVTINNKLAEVGQILEGNEVVQLDGAPIVTQDVTTIMLHKPIKTICSKVQQGNVATVYSLLPESLQHLTYLGRLDKDTSGLLIMTNDGNLIQRISHPSHEVEKEYDVVLRSTIRNEDKVKIEQGILLEDGPSSLKLSGSGREWKVVLHEGRNRQIRRTFEALGYEIERLHRVRIGKLELGNLPLGQYRELQPGDVQ